ncbi:MAG: tail fiber domain-containing protein [Leadbetterella sp.]
MKKYILYFLVISYLPTLGQSVLISPSNGSSLIEASGTNKAVKLPSVSATTVITSPQKGMVVFDDATGSMSYYNGSIWVPLTNSSTGWVASGTDINNTNSGRVGIGTTAPATLLHVAAGDAGTVSPRSGTIQTLETNGSNGYLSILTPNNATSGVAFGSPDGNADGSINYDHLTQKLTLRTKASTRMTIDSIGNVGMGNTSPNVNALLDMSSTTKGVLIPRMTTTQRNAIPITTGLAVYDNTTKGFWFHDGTDWRPFSSTWTTAEDSTFTNTFTTSNAVSIGAPPRRPPGTTGGNVGNGRLQITGVQNSDQLSLIHPSNTAMKWGLYVSSLDTSLNFYQNNSNKATIDRVTGVYAALSDRNFKKNIVELSPVLKNVLKLNSYTYNYIDNKDSERKTMGFMAQDVQPYFPELVFSKKDRETNESYLMMNYSGFSVLAIKAIQEQQVIINHLQAQIDELKTSIKK